MSLAAMNWARQQKTGSATRKAVLMAIADYADETGSAWPSQRRVAEDTEMTDRTVRTALVDLIALGLIARKTKRNRDGTRNTDRLQLLMTDDMRKQFPLDDNRKELPVDQPPENDDRTTGNSRPNHRKMTTEPPEAVSAKPTIEPPENPQQNRSDADASDGRAVVPFPVRVQAGRPPVCNPDDDPAVHLCWWEGKQNLVACGASERSAGSLIGSLLGLGHPHRLVLEATRAAVRAGTRDPMPFMRAYLAQASPAKRLATPAKSSAATRLLDRMKARHERDRTASQSSAYGPDPDDESDGHSHRSVH